MSNTSDERGTSDTERDADDGAVVSISRKGQATIPKRLREKHGIETPGKVRVRENEDGDIVVEPVASVREMRGAASGNWRGTELLAESREADEERDRRLRGGDDR